jgi:hypothetical protein
MQIMKEDEVLQLCTRTLGGIPLVETCELPEMAHDGHVADDDVVED